MEQALATGLPQVVTLGGTALPLAGRMIPGRVYSGRRARTSASCWMRGREFAAE